MSSAEAISMSEMFRRGAVDPEGAWSEKGRVSKDEIDLARFGKRQQMERRFSLLSIIGISCTLMLTWEGSLALLQALVLNGGPGGAFCGFIFVFVGVLAQALVSGEMASMIPLAGGPYNWVAVLAPPEYSNFLSYLTGWTSTIAWQGLLASVAFLDATIIAAVAAETHPEYNYQPWHGTLILWCIVLLCILVNTFLGRLLPGLEALVLIMHIIGFFGILITICYLAPHNTADVVFQTFINGGEFTTYGQSFFVGSLTSMFMFTGVDAASHLSEEIQNPRIVVPWAMVATIILNGLLGIGMLIAILFCMGDLEDVLNSKSPFVFVDIFANITHSTASAAGLTSILLIVTIAGAFGLLATTSRMLWAFSREGAVPGSRWLSRVTTSHRLPVWSIAVSATISMLLALINIGSTSAFNAFTNLTVAGFYSSFFVAAAVLLHKKLTCPASDIPYGPFRLGVFGIPITIFAMAFSVIGWFFSFWPPTADVNATNFNWSVVVYWGTLLIALAWWFIRARRTYTGPKFEL